jgi:hypothetical protein
MESFEMAEYKVRRVIAYYSREDEFIVGDIDLPDVDAQALRDLFGVPADDPMYGCFPVEDRHVPKLEELCGVPIDLKKYYYFVEEIAETTP